MPEVQVGRQLHYYRNAKYAIRGPFCAHVCKVNEDGTLNLVYWDIDGAQGVAKNVYPPDNGMVDARAEFCVWPPREPSQSVEIPVRRESQGQPQDNATMAFDKEPEQSIAEQPNAGDLQSPAVVEKDAEPKVQDDASGGPK